MTTKSLIFDDCVILLSPTLTDKPLKSHFHCGDLNKINYVFGSLTPLEALVVIGDGSDCGIGGVGGKLHAQFSIRRYSAAF